MLPQQQMVVQQPQQPHMLMKQQVLPQQHQQLVVPQQLVQGKQYILASNQVWEYGNIDNANRITETC